MGSCLATLRSGEIKSLPARLRDWRYPFEPKTLLHLGAGVERCSLRCSSSLERAEGGRFVQARQHIMPALADARRLSDSGLTGYPGKQTLPGPNLACSAWSRTPRTRPWGDRASLPFDACCHSFDARLS